MRLILALAIALSCVSAFAQDTVTRRFNFTYFGSDVGTRTYYNCDSAEQILRDHLESLGAQNVRTSCFGGIQNWGNRWDATPVSLSARFSVSTDSSRVSRVVLSSNRSGNSDCDFNVSLLGQLLKVMPNVKMVSRSSSCRGAEGRWNYTLDVAL